MLVVETYLNESKGKGVGIFAKKPILKGDIWWVRNENFDKLITPENIFSLKAKE
jgi:hypothetical protein